MTDKQRDLELELDGRVSFILNSHQDHEPINARAILDSIPEIRTKPKLVLDLVVAEYVRELDLGHPVEIEAFIDRFPEVDDPVVLRETLQAVDVFRDDPDFNSLLFGEFEWPDIGDLIFDDLRLERELGRGSASRVFLAKEQSAGARDIVVKLCIDGSGPGNEAHILGPMSHPNIGQVLSVRRDPERFPQFYAICMPYEAETTLADAVARHLNSPANDDPAADRVHVERMVRIAAQVADALAYTHQEGIQHGDVKPTNVLLADDDRPILIDFNLSSRHELDEGVTGGTIMYLPPERFAALLDEQPAEPTQDRGPVPQSGDVFAFGVMLFEALSGRLPFGDVPELRGAGSLIFDPDLMNVLREYRAQQAGTVLSVRTELPQLPAALADTLQRCLSFAPAERPTFTEIAGELRSLLPAEPASRFVGNRRTWLLVGAAVVVTSVTAMVVIPAMQKPENRTAIQKALDAYESGRYRDADEWFTRAVRQQPLNADELTKHGLSKMRLAEKATTLAEKRQWTDGGVASFLKAIEVDASREDENYEHIGACRRIVNRGRPREAEQHRQFGKWSKSQIVGELTKMRAMMRTPQRPENLDFVDYACSRWPNDGEIRGLAMHLYAMEFPRSGQNPAFKAKFFEHGWCLVESRAGTRKSTPYLSMVRRVMSISCKSIAHEPEFQQLLKRLTTGMPLVGEPRPRS